MTKNEMIVKHEKEGTFECKVCHLIKDSYVEIIRHKHYTVKEWKRLDTDSVRKIGDKEYYLNMQEVLCKKYEIILLDHQTKKEKLNQILDKFSFENLDKTMTKVSKGIDSFAKAVEPPKKSKKKSKPDYSFLFSNK